jgi:hypothetical protein
VWPSLRKNKIYVDIRIAHRYSVTSVLLKPLKQSPIDVTAFRLSKSLYSRFSQFSSKRAKNFGSVLQIFPIVEFMRPKPRYKLASFFLYSVSLVTLTLPLQLKTFLLCVTVARLSFNKSTYYSISRKVDGNFTHKVNYRWDINSFGIHVLRSVDW